MTYRLVIVLIFSNILWGCGTTSTTGNSDKSQIIVVHAYHSLFYLDEINNTIINKPSTQIIGYCFANPIPEFNYLKAADSICTRNYYDMFSPGFLKFGQSYDSGRGFKLINNINPLSVEVSTSIGTLRGIIAVPDTISNLKATPNDTLHAGQSLKVEWDGKADFFVLLGIYTWRDSTGSYGSKILRKFISGNSYTFDNSLFTVNGELELFWITPMNGPIPKSDTIGNMSGDGHGFLYYIESRKYLKNKIIIHDGSGYQKGHTIKPVSPMDIETLINNRLLGK